MPRPNLLHRIWLVGLVATVPCASIVAKPANAAGASIGSSPSHWETQDASRQVTLGEGVKLQLGPNTKVLRLPSIPAPARTKGMAARAYVLELLRGRLDVEIDMTRQAYAPVMVRAPMRVNAYLKGGCSTMIASREGVAVAARTGDDISGGIADKWRPVRIGTALVVSRDRPGGETRALLASPTLEAANSLALSLGSVAPTRLSWTSIAGAQGYRLTVTSESNDERTSAERFDLKQTFFSLPRLKPGRYTAAVSAIDAWELDSPASNLVPVRVVGVELPEGAYLRAGVPQLGDWQSIRLTYTEDLELAYGSGMVFGPAPETIRLPPGRPLVARLREAGRTEEVTLRIEPRAVSSSIVFVPSRAQWPGKPVSVSVNISGPDGGPLPDSIDVNLTTSINSETIDVDWKRVGSTWVAQIPQPPMAGPWVLRVLASDQTGQVLARDFIEIATPPKPTRTSEARSYYSSR